MIADLITQLAVMTVIGGGLVGLLVLAYAAVCAARGEWEEFKDEWSDDAAVESLCAQLRRGPREQITEAVIAERRR